MARTTLTSGIAWIRRRQRALARAVLAVFALAWLQAAVVPCAMAFAAQAAAPVAQPVHEGGHAGHAGHAGQESPAPPAHCPYCPPTHGDSPEDGAHEAGCAFPHDPRIDARSPSPTFGPPPCAAFGVVAGLVEPSFRIAVSDVPSDVPRRPLAISYCRFIE
jgi:hypothetical protein